MEENNNSLVPCEIQENTENDSRKYDSFDYVKEAERIDTKQEPSTAAKVLLILMSVYLSLIGAVIGIVVGLVYMGKRAEGYKKFGKVLLVVSIVNLVLGILTIISVVSAATAIFDMFVMM